MDALENAIGEFALLVVYAAVLFDVVQVDHQVPLENHVMVEVLRGREGGGGGGREGGGGGGREGGGGGGREGGGGGGREGGGGSRGGRRGGGGREGLVTVAVCAGWSHSPRSTC